MTTSALSSAAAQLHRLADRLADRLPLPPALRRNPRAAAALAVAALGVALPALWSRAAASYRGFLALGPGGMPHNVAGWALQGLLQLLARRDTRDPAPLARPRNRRAAGPHGGRTFLRGIVPPRAGARPDVPGYVAPQRQTDQGPADAEATRRRMAAHLEALVAGAEGAGGGLALRPSRLEGVGTPALWLDVTEGQQQLPAFLRGLRGETAHVHPECSSHVTVSMADAEELVRKGWAERHRLSGVAFMPWSYVLVYAPRDEAEFEVWKDIVGAGVRFVCAAAGREVVVDGE